MTTKVIEFKCKYVQLEDSEERVYEFDPEAQTIEEAKVAVQKEIDEKDTIDTYSRDGNDEDYLSNNSKAGR